MLRDRLRRVIDAHRRGVVLAGRMFQLIALLEIVADHLADEARRPPRLPDAWDELPQTRSPAEVWHSEAYLLRCLKRQYGWAQPDANTLFRYRREP